MISASASSPPEAPPIRTTRPTPIPTNNPPTIAASNGIPLKSGITNPICSKML